MDQRASDACSGSLGGTVGSCMGRSVGFSCGRSGMFGCWISFCGWFSVSCVRSGSGCCGGVPGGAFGGCWLVGCFPPCAPAFFLSCVFMAREVDVFIVQHHHHAAPRVNVNAASM